VNSRWIDKGGDARVENEARRKLNKSLVNS
jgi:hypothetical protein